MFQKLTEFSKVQMDAPKSKKLNKLNFNVNDKTFSVSTCTALCVNERLIPFMFLSISDNRSARNRPQHGKSSKYNGNILTVIWTRPLLSKKISYH